MAYSCGRRGLLLQRDLDLIAGRVASGPDERQGLVIIEIFGRRGQLGGDILDRTALPEKGGSPPTRDSARRHRIR